MKKALIIFGILLIVGIITVWGYLFVYGTPQNANEVFARFNLGGEEREPTVLPETTLVDVGQTTQSGAVQKLKQLTTRPAAGATFTGTGILYVEQGTGHIYHINFSSGGETLVSGTTIPKTYEAVFSDGGAYVAITSLEGGIKKTIVGSVTANDNSLEGTALPSNVSEIAFGGTAGTLMYLSKEENGSIGYSFNIDKKVSTRLFSIPLREVQVIWGTPTYVYTTPSSVEVGYLYKIAGEALSYVSLGSMRLSAFLYDGNIVITRSLGEKIYSDVINDSGNIIVPLSLLALPEKCTSAGPTLYCASPRRVEVGQFPDDWYSGQVSLSDGLWTISGEEGTATLLNDFLIETGREIDVKKIGTNETGEYIYFINKNDNTLWMFDTTL